MSMRNDVFFWFVQEDAKSTGSALPDVMEMQLQIHDLKRSVNRILEILQR